MDLHVDMKKQLMAMAGITEMAEFDEMVKDMAPDIKEKVTEASTKKKQHSPFHIHFVQMLALLEEAGSGQFDVLNGDLEDQIQNTFVILQQKYPEFSDVRNFMASNNKIEVSLCQLHAK
jgi:hypothetical protein